jgi:hypothetical protein
VDPKFFNFRLEDFSRIFWSLPENSSISRFSRIFHSVSSDQKVSTAPNQASLEVQDRLVRFQHFRLQGAVKLGDLHGHHGAGVLELFGEENLLQRMALRSRMKHRSHTGLF